MKDMRYLGKAKIGEKVMKTDGCQWMEVGYEEMEDRAFLTAVIVPCTML